MIYNKQSYYESPRAEVLEILVSKSFAQGSWGEENAPGADFQEQDYGSF